MKLENPLIIFLNSERKSMLPSDEEDRKILEHIGMSIAGLEPFDLKTIEVIEKRIHPWVVAILKSRTHHSIIEEFGPTNERTKLHIDVDPPQPKGTIRGIDRAWGFVAYYLLMDPKDRPKIGVCHYNDCLQLFPIARNTSMQRFCSNRCRMRAKRYPSNVTESALLPDPRGCRKKD